ncbi:class I SAM-dependent methyltransferase [Candidatus Woesearchaeota archaeon]|nr:class I SAM-dependent methyltransferase [Candidatus Woesearchaeota archaeon]
MSFGNEKREEQYNTQHYFSEKQDSSFVPKKITVSVAGLRFELFSAKGVFSKRELDPGSKVLIESAVVASGARTLDLGCGYGIVGISIKKKCPSVDLSLSDVNERALRLTRMNLELHRMKAKVIHSDGFSNIGECFDVILLNPPQSAGKDVCFRLIKESFSHLCSGGSLQLVARPSKGGRTLAYNMKDVFGNASVIGKRGGFSVYMSVKS